MGEPRVRWSRGIIFMFTSMKFHKTKQAIHSHTWVLMPVNDRRHSDAANFLNRMKELRSSAVARWVGWLGARSAVFGGCFQLWREGESAVA